MKKLEKFRFFPSPSVYRAVRLLFVLNTGDLYKSEILSYKGRVLCVIKLNAQRDRAWCKY